jgi:hypothetical protein
MLYFRQRCHEEVAASNDHQLLPLEWGMRGGCTVAAAAAATLLVYKMSFFQDIEGLASGGGNNTNTQAAGTTDASGNDPNTQQLLSSTEARNLCASHVHYIYEHDCTFLRSRSCYNFLFNNKVLKVVQETSNISCKADMQGNHDWSSPKLGSSCPNRVVHTSPAATNRYLSLNLAC